MNVRLPGQKRANSVESVYCAAGRCLPLIPTGINVKTAAMSGIFTTYPTTHIVKHVLPRPPARSPREVSWMSFIKKFDGDFRRSQQKAPSNTMSATAKNTG